MSDKNYTTATGVTVQPVPMYAVDPTTGLAVVPATGSGGGATLGIANTMWADPNSGSPLFYIRREIDASGVITFSWENLDGTVATPVIANLRLASGQVQAVTSVDIGTQSDAVATTDTGVFSALAFVKRGLGNWTALLARIPALVAGRVPVDGSAVTQPVSAAALPLPTGASTAAGVAIVNTTLGAPFQAGGAIGNAGFGITGTLPAYAATPTVNIGTAPVVAVTGTFFQITQPVSNASLPLPAGAATSALQPAINADGGAQTHVQNFPATQAISAAALPLPAGASIETGNLATIAGNGARTAAGTTAATAIPVQGVTGGIAMPVSNAAEATALALLHTDLAAATPAGANLIGSVSIDQTTPGTTNRVAVTDSSGVSQFNFPAGFVRTSDEPRQVFYDPFDAPLDTVNLWQAPTTGNSAVAASTTAGTMTLETGTTASGWSKLISQPSFKPVVPAWLGFSFALALPDGAAPIANAYRFWGAGNPAAVPTPAAPMTDAVGFEVATTGKMYAVVYAAGVRTQIADLSASGTNKQPLDALLHRYIVYVRTDKAFFYIDGLANANLVATANFQSPSIQTLPLSLVAAGFSTPPASSAKIQSAGLAVWDTGKNASGISDGTFPWRKMAVNAAGAASVAGALTSIDLGAQTDAVATTDTGTFSVLAFVKRGLQNWTSLLAKIPALGQKTMAASLPVVLASDQAAIAVSNASLPLPNGASTSGLQSSVQSAPGTSATVAETIQGSATGVPVPVSNAAEATALALLHTDMQAATPAGANIVGKFGIDQTTPGTTNAVQISGGVARTAAMAVFTTSGSVASGAKNASFYNSGTTAATVAGGSLAPGATVFFSTTGPDTLAAIAYVASATAILQISTVA